MAADAVISRQIARTAIPRRFTQMAREIWQFQPRLLRRTGKRPQRLLAHPRFRAAYDFLLLRNRAGEPLQELCDWWTAAQKDALPAGAAPEAEAAPARPRRRRRRRAGGGGNAK